MVNNKITVEEYNPEWPATFERLKQTLWEAVKDTAISIEHVGSTSVPGLAAKPVIDLDIVIASAQELGRVIELLKPLGYVSRGDQGIPDREAFDSPAGLPSHHLYVCPKDSLALRNHLMVRDHLRRDPTARQRYAELKYELALNQGDSRERYTAGKTALILEMLQANGMGQEQMRAIHSVNQAGAELRIRDFEFKDRRVCLSLFDGNTPGFFLPKERREFERYLDGKLPGRYFVLERNGEVVACGGYGVDHLRVEAHLTWDMVKSGLHGKGFGGHLLEERLRRIRAKTPARRVTLQTSQLSKVFYEKHGFKVVSYVPQGLGGGRDRYEMVYAIHRTQARRKSHESSS